MPTGSGQVRLGTVRLGQAPLPPDVYRGPLGPILDPVGPCRDLSPCRPFPPPLFFKLTITILPTLFPHPNFSNLVRPFPIEKLRVLTNEIGVCRINGKPSQLRGPVLTLELLVENRFEVGGRNGLLELIEVDVVVDDDAALAEGLDLQPVEGVADQGVAINFSELNFRETIRKCEELIPLFDNNVMDFVI